MHTFIEKNKKALIVGIIILILIILVILFRTFLSIGINEIAAKVYYKYPSHFTETIWRASDGNSILVHHENTSDYSTPEIYKIYSNENEILEFETEKVESARLPNGININWLGKNGLDQYFIEELVMEDNGVLRSKVLLKVLGYQEEILDQEIISGEGDFLEIENEIKNEIIPVLVEGYSYLETEFIENKSIQKPKDELIIAKAKIKIDSCNQYGVIPVVLNLNSYEYKLDTNLVNKLIAISCEEVVAPNLTQVALCDDCLLYPVDKTHGLTKDFEPAIQSDIWGEREFEVDERLVINLIDMLNAATEAGHNINLTSAYRSYETQVDTFKYWTDWNQNVFGYTRPQAIEAANNISAKPGFSEHQLGTAVDLNAIECENFEGFCEENESLWAWLAENAPRYGFVLSYPYGKDEVTGYSYEPWHYRWVGEKNARIFLEQVKTLNLWLEEFYYRD